MRHPQPAEEYITVVDNKRRERIQRVEYIVTDVHNETVYVTAGGLAYARDSLVRRRCDAPFVSCYELCSATGRKTWIRPITCRLTPPSTSPPMRSLTSISPRRPPSPLISSTTSTNSSPAEGGR